MAWGYSPLCGGMPHHPAWLPRHSHTSSASRAGVSSLSFWEPLQHPQKHTGVSFTSTQDWFSTHTHTCKHRALSLLLFFCAIPSFPGAWLAAQLHCLLCMATAVLVQGVPWENGSEVTDVTVPLCTRQGQNHCRASQSNLGVCSTKCWHQDTWAFLGYIALPAELLVTWGGQDCCSLA